ncbi:MAG: hypothetical protein PF636_10065 [Actinomycetota bacterium]|jgi:hypothetical protein|nr:hypothetical protein [Actinomycetota bacterium]
MMRNPVSLCTLCLVTVLAVVGLSGCAERTQGTTVGVIAKKIDFASASMQPAPADLCVELEDGTEIIATCDEELLEECGLVLPPSEVTLTTWGGVYAIFKDDVPDQVVLVQDSSGSWEAVEIAD